ncbi:hypothetical protein [Vibrio harveyi]|nr:hypothetical protein [Vibrio harveyi]
MKDSRYVVRTKKGIVYAAFDGEKFNAFIYPPKDPFHKICFQVRVYFQQSKVSSLKVIDLNNNGDECSHCNKGYGTELVMTAFSILSEHFHISHDAMIPIIGSLCPGENLDIERAHKRRSHFWSKFFTVEDSQNPYSKFEGLLKDVVTQAESFQMETLLCSLPSRLTALEIVKQLQWLPQDTLAMKAMIQDIDSYNDALEHLNKNQVGSNLLTIDNYMNLPSVIFSWLQRISSNQREKVRIERETKASILERDYLNFGLIYRYFKHVNINVTEGVYVYHFMLSPRISLEQISSILLKARIDK